VSVAGAADQSVEHTVDIDDVIVAADADADGFDDHVCTPARGTPAVLSRPGSDVGWPESSYDDADAFGDEVVTPARGTPRPALFAPGAVRFVVEEAPARPRHDALSADEVARNRLRARELYLVAIDDLGDGDANGAVMHLQLAIAYDDQTPLYQDLLEQIAKKQQRAG
jgi:hypothetical protein